MRRKRIEQAYLDGLSQMEYMLDAVASPEDQMQIIQAINQLCKALEGVSEKHSKLLFCITSKAIPIKKLPSV